MTQPGLASTDTIRLSRPHTSYAAFMYDRNACMSAAGHRGPDFTGGNAIHVSQTSYSLKDFADCMNAKGYLLDPNGYRAAKYYRLADGGYLLAPN
jgi:hypothetical protein